MSQNNNKDIADAYREEFIAPYDFEDDNMDESYDSDDADEDAQYAKVYNNLRPCDKYAETFYDINHDEYTNGAEDGQCPVFAKRSEYDDNGEPTTDSECGESGYNNDEGPDDSLYDRHVAPFDLFTNDDNQDYDNQSDAENFNSYNGDDRYDQNYTSEYGIDDFEDANSFD